MSLGGSPRAIAHRISVLVAVLLSVGWGSTVAAYPPDNNLTPSTSPPIGPGSIPASGTDATSSTLLIGAGFVLFGAAFLVVARLRRREQTTAAA